MASISEMSRALLNLTQSVPFSLQQKKRNKKITERRVTLSLQTCFQSALFRKLGGSEKSFGYCKMKAYIIHALKKLTRPIVVEEEQTSSPHVIPNLNGADNQISVRFEDGTFFEDNKSQDSHLTQIDGELSVDLPPLNQCSPMATPRFRCTFSCEQPIFTEAWESLRRSVVHFRGHMVGTLAALDNASDALNYDQVFVRDFVPSALAFLMNNEPDIVKNFLMRTLQLQLLEKRIDRFTLAQGVMPASFKVLHNPDTGSDTLLADFGEVAIGRVPPVDSGFWWIILLHAYTKATGDYSLSQMIECQTGIKRILSLCLAEGFDTFPTLLCADGCCMVDRRMGVYGYPIEIQAMFFMALRCAHQLLLVERDGEDFIKMIEKRLSALTYHIHSYYWLDFQQLNDIYRFKTEEYSHTALNKFNVIPESIPEWIFDFMPMDGGYFIGNVCPAQMDFRWFALGNCIAILSSLATSNQSIAIMDLIEEKWEDLVGKMPMKLVYPALESHEWKTETGCDQKNTRWSYHNGGSWPVLLWLLTAACVKAGKPELAKKAIELAERRLAKDGWPEYYDGKDGYYIGKQSRKMQTSSIAGYLVAKMLIDDPSRLDILAIEDDMKMKHTFARSTTLPNRSRVYNQ